MQIGCNKDLVCLSAGIRCQLTRRAKWKKKQKTKKKDASDVAVNLSVLALRIFAASQKFPGFSVLFLIILSEHFCLSRFFSPNFFLFSLRSLSWGTPEVQLAVTDGRELAILWLRNLTDDNDPILTRKKNERKKKTTLATIQPFCMFTRSSILLSCK